MHLCNAHLFICAHMEDDSRSSSDWISEFYDTYHPPLIALFQNTKTGVFEQSPGAAVFGFLFRPLCAAVFIYVIFSQILFLTNQVKIWNTFIYQGVNLWQLYLIHGAIPVALQDVRDRCAWGISTGVQIQEEARSRWARPRGWASLEWADESRICFFSSNF